MLFDALRQGPSAKSAQKMKAASVMAPVNLSQLAPTKSSSDWMSEYLRNPPPLERLQALTAPQRKAFKKFLKENYPIDLASKGARETGVAVIRLLDDIDRC